MRAEMSQELRGLLREVAERHCPEYLGKLHGDDRFTADERLALQQATANELLVTGLRDDDEPNERGLRLELLIDFLGRE